MIGEAQVIPRRQQFVYIWFYLMWAHWHGDDMRYYLSGYRLHVYRASQDPWF